MTEYEARFTALSCFAPEMVSTDLLKCRRFERGLKFSLRDRVVGHRHKEYSAVVETTLILEANDADTGQAKEKLSTLRRGASSAPGHQQTGQKRTRDDVGSSGGARQISAP